MNDERKAPDEQTHALATEMLSEVMGEIDRADHKASLLIGSLGIAFSIVLSGILGGDWTPESLSPFGLVLWIVGSARGQCVGRLGRHGGVAAPEQGPRTRRHHVLGTGARARVAAGGRRGARRTRAACRPSAPTSSCSCCRQSCSASTARIRWSMVLAGVGIALVVASFFFVSS